MAGKHVEGGAAFCQEWLSIIQSVVASRASPQERADIVQEVCLAMLRRTISGPVLRNPRAYVKTVAQNAVRKAAKERSRSICSDSPAVERAVAESPEQVRPALKWRETVERFEAKLRKELTSRDLMVLMSTRRGDSLHAIALRENLDRSQVRRSLKRIESVLRALSSG